MNITRTKSVAGGGPVITEMTIENKTASRPPSLIDFIRQVEGDIISEPLG